MVERRTQRSARTTSSRPWRRSADRRRTSSTPGSATALEIGARNRIREFVTMNRGTAAGGGRTRIGDDNLFMAYAHVAHDCQRREPHDLRQRGDARRARGGRRRLDHRGVQRGAPVHPRRPPRVHRRILGGDAGRPSVGADRRQPRRQPRGERRRTPSGGATPRRPSRRIKTLLHDPVPFEDRPSKMRSSASRRELGGVPEVRYFLEFVRRAPAASAAEAGANP